MAAKSLIAALRITSGKCRPRRSDLLPVIAVEDAVVGKVSEKVFSEVAARYPDMYRFIAQELARRLLQRNSLLNAYRDRIRLFIISSAEALPIARAIQNAFSHDPFTTVIWTDGVFRVTNYTPETLESEVDNSDFAIAVAVRYRRELRDRYSQGRQHSGPAFPASIVNSEPSTDGTKRM